MKKLLKLFMPFIVLSSIMALFWTIWYFITGDVPKTKNFMNLLGWNPTVSRWWDVLFILAIIPFAKLFGMFAGRAFEGGGGEPLDIGLAILFFGILVFYLFLGIPFGFFFSTILGIFVTVITAIAIFVLMFLGVI